MQTFTPDQYAAFKAALMKAIKLHGPARVVWRYDAPTKRYIIRLKKEE
jgi:hypothetical protein